MKNYLFYQKLIFFSVIMFIFGFLTSYITDFIFGRKIILLPSHSVSMATGIFSTSALVFLLFSNRYIKYKCSK